MKKQDEKWKICSFCKHIKECGTGRDRIKDLAHNPHAVNEIGCFNYEIYKKQSGAKQLRLFRADNTIES